MTRSYTENLVREKTFTFVDTDTIRYDNVQIIIGRDMWHRFFICACFPLILYTTLPRLPHFMPTMYITNL